MNRSSLTNALICFIVVLTLISNAVSQPAMEMNYPQPGKAEHKRFYSWEEGKRSADDYERTDQHNLLKRRVYQLSPDTWTTYFRL
uniref:Uncharacterized protein n=1 Tax=Panagrolaimus sp. ES5 TaxID=591445 RepID=A0AC34GXV1_9BILA